MANPIIEAIKSIWYSFQGIEKRIIYLQSQKKNLYDRIDAVRKKMDNGTSRERKEHMKVMSDYRQEIRDLDAEILRLKKLDL